MENSYREMFTIAFFDDGTALLIRENEEEITVNWEGREHIFILYYPSDGDFQYTVYYQYMAVDFSTIVITLHDIFQYPRAGIMTRLSMAY